MREERVNRYSVLGWLILTGILLTLVLTFLVLNGVHRKEGGAIAAASPVAASSPSVESAAENARRAAVSRLGPIKHEGVNAADLYKQALGLYAQLTDDEKTILKRRYDKKMDPKTAAALFAKILPIMDLLRQARTANYADWGLGPMTFEQGWTDKGSQMQAITTMAKLGFWEAGYRFANDPAGGAVSDVAAVDAMGRSAVDSLIGLLVADGIHAGSVSILAQNAGFITGADGPDLAYIVDPTAVQQSFQAGVNSEVSMLRASLDEYANPATKNQSIVQKWAGQGGDPQQMVSWVQWMIQTEQALAASLPESDAQFQQWWAGKQSEASATPFLNTAVPALASVRTRAQFSLAENAMLEAGMALEQNNQAQFQSIADPATGQPFIYTQTADGFRLGSALKQNGKPVTLSFSTPAPK